MKDIAFSMLVTGWLKLQLETRVPDFRAIFDSIQRSVSPALIYPDGSLEYELHPETEPFWLACMNLKQAGMSCRFFGYIPSLPWFPGSPKARKFKLISSVEHEKRVDPSGCLMFGPRHEESPKSADLTALHLTVQCHRRIRRDAMPLLAGVVRDWHASVSEAGLFGEGPVGQLSGEIEFQGRLARLSFDASRTGQRTINWLILSLLNATYDAVKLTALVFNDLENLASYGIEPSDDKIVRLALGDRQSHPEQSPADDPQDSRRPVGSLPFAGLKIVRLPLSDQQSHAEQSPADGSPDSRLPAGLLPFPGQQSDEFTIWQTPSFEWESIHLAVYFEDWPNREQQRDFRTLLGAWSVVAQSGGFGGEGGKYVGDPVFMKKQQAAYLQANVGDTDPDIAVPVLVRMLENYSSGSLAIEAVVFGLDPDTKFVI